MNYKITIDVSISATVTVAVQAENAEQARKQIDEQLNQRVSDATDAVHETFSEIIRKEPLDYTLNVEETAKEGSEETDASEEGGS